MRLHHLAILFITAVFVLGLTADSLQAEADFSQPAESPGRPLRLLPLKTGSRLTPRCALAAEASCFSMVDMVHTAWLVEHPSGSRFLIDAGLGREARRDLLLFGLFQRAALDYVEGPTLGRWLERLRSPKIDFVVLTHLHWDHSSGLCDMDAPRVILAPEEKQLLAQLAPDDFTTGMRHHFADSRIETFAWAHKPFGPFDKTHDLFGDGSVVLVHLPGHTHGSMGVLLNRVEGKRILFTGDASWSLDGIRIPSHRPDAARKLVDMDRDATEKTLLALHRLTLEQPDLIIVPSHDGDAFNLVDKWVRTGEFPKNGK